MSKQDYTLKLFASCYAEMQKKHKKNKQTNGINNTTTTVFNVTTRLYTLVIRKLLRGNAKETFKINK